MGNNKYFSTDLTKTQIRTARSAVCLAMQMGQHAAETDVQHRVNCISLLPGNKLFLCEKSNCAETTLQAGFPLLSCHKATLFH